MLTGAGYLFSESSIFALGPIPIINILKPLSESTACGGIVKWNELATDTTSAMAFLKILGMR
jgi:hypothetical protein